MLTQVSSTTKQVVDWTALGITVSSTISWIPWLLALPSAIWYCIRIYDWWLNRNIKD